MGSPIVGSYGGKDRTPRGAADRLERALRAVEVEHDVKEYPEAGHSFLNDHEGAGRQNPFRLRLGAVFGILSPGIGLRRNLREMHGGVSSRSWTPLEAVGESPGNDPLPVVTFGQYDEPRRPIPSVALLQIRIQGELVTGCALRRRN